MRLLLQKKKQKMMKITYQKYNSENKVHCIKVMLTLKWKSL
jgi:hypothetical protein